MRNSDDGGDVDDDDDMLLSQGQLLVAAVVSRSAPHNPHNDSTLSAPVLEALVAGEPLPQPLEEALD